MAEGQVDGPNPDDERISYVEFEPVPPPNALEASMYFNEPDVRPPNSPGVYDLPDSTNVFRMSRRQREPQPEVTNQNKQPVIKQTASGWSIWQIVAISLISIISIAALGTAMFSLLDGKLYFCLLYTSDAADE